MSVSWCPRPARCSTRPMARPAASSPTPMRASAWSNSWKGTAHFWQPVRRADYVRRTMKNRFTQIGLIVLVGAFLAWLLMPDDDEPAPARTDVVEEVLDRN